ncbi:MAG: hypothetical protein ACETWQ_07365 [Phycisphaerae bacterium]
MYRGTERSEVNPDTSGHFVGQILRLRLRMTNDEGLFGLGGSLKAEGFGDGECRRSHPQACARESGYCA